MKELFKEPGPEGVKKYEEKVKEWHKEIIANLKRDGFEPTPAEAIFLRQTIRECFNEDDKTTLSTEKTGGSSMDCLFTYPEIFERFFWHFYGINISEYLRGIKPEYQDQARKDMYRYIQKKLRTDRELV